MIATLIAACQLTAAIVLGDDATAAQVAELTATMRSADWIDLADGCGLPRPTPEHVMAAQAHLRLAAQAERARAEMAAAWQAAR